MYELDDVRANSLLFAADMLRGDEVYVRSVTEGRQYGRVFADSRTDPKSVLFWHYCGFAYLTGEPDGEMLSCINKLLLEHYEPCQRRFRLHIYDNAAARYFGQLDGVCSWTQALYRLPEGAPLPSAARLPDGYEAGDIDARFFEYVREGKVTPYYSWRTAEEFLGGGMGCCISHGDEPASWSITSAIGGGCADIGVETAQQHRKLGLGRAAAAALIARVARAGLTPLWRCAAHNEGSAAIARSLGFVKTGEHPVFMKKQ